VPPLDPERAQWEAGLLLTYAECAAKHLATIGAWDDAVKRK